MQGEAIVRPRRTALLLGAGASRDAGLPLTFQLAEAIVRDANSKPLRGRMATSGRNGWVAALNFVYGSMMGHQSDDGGNPLEAVNIERLISALRLLQEVENHEAAPFVLNWKASVHNLGSSNFRSSDFGRAGDRLVQALSTALQGRRGFAGRDVESAVAAISTAALSASRGDKRVFKEAEDAILQGLVRILSDISSVDYMKPVASLALEQDGGLDVLTLNYDLTVETLARESGVALVTGIEDWQPGSPLSLPIENRRINLLKMHGSLNWEHEGALSPTAPVRITLRSDADAAEEDGQFRPHRQLKPWIVVGDREKLATDGPTLYLYAAAQEILARTDNLVVVGYGFADTHVNNLVRDWMSGDDRRTITLLDPSVSTSSSDANDFRAALIASYGADGANLGSRIGLVPKGAKDGLEEALHYSYPEPMEISSYFSVLPSSDEGEYSVAKIVCEGPGVSDLEVSVSIVHGTDQNARTSPVDAGTSQSDLNEKLERQRPYSRGTYYATLGPIERGAHRDVYFPRHAGQRINFSHWARRSGARNRFHAQKLVVWPTVPRQMSEESCDDHQSYPPSE